MSHDDRQAFKLPPMEEEEFLIVRHQHRLTWLLTIGIPCLLPIAAMQFNWIYALGAIASYKTYPLAAVIIYGLCRLVFPKAIRAYTWRYRHYKNGRGWRNGSQ